MFDLLLTYVKVCERCQTHDIWVNCFSCDFRNSEQNKCLWKLGDISEKSDNEGKRNVSIITAVIGCCCCCCFALGVLWSWEKNQSLQNLNFCPLPPPTPKRCRVSESQVWTGQWSIEPLHSGRAVHERRHHAVWSRHGAPGQRVQTVPQQEEICHRCVSHWTTHTHT